MHPYSIGLIIVLTILLGYRGCSYTFGASCCSSNLVIVIFIYVCTFVSNVEHETYRLHGEWYHFCFVRGDGGVDQQSALLCEGTAARMPVKIRAMVVPLLFCNTWFANLLVRDTTH